MLGTRALCSPRRSDDPTLINGCKNAYIAMRCCRCSARQNTPSRVPPTSHTRADHCCGDRLRPRALGDTQASAQTNDALKQCFRAPRAPIGKQLLLGFDSGLLWAAAAPPCVPLGKRPLLVITCGFEGIRFHLVSHEAVTKIVWHWGK